MSGPIVVPGTFSSTPATKSFAQLKSEVARYVLLVTSSDALSVAGDGIVEAIRTINSRNWYWALSSQTITFTADEDQYDLNNDFKSAKAFELHDADDRPRSVLQYLDPWNFTREYPVRAVSSQPTTYTVFNPFADGKLTLNVPAAASFVAAYPTGSLIYHSRIQEPTQDSDVITVPSEAQSYITMSAKAYVAAHYDPEKVGYAEGKSQQIWVRIVASDNEIHYQDAKEYP